MVEDTAPTPAIAEEQDAAVPPPRRRSSRTTCWSRTSRSTACAASTRPTTMRPASTHDARAWALGRRASRCAPSPFGALAYHFGTRRLSFLKHPELVRGGRGARPSTSTAEPACDARRGRATSDRRRDHARAGARSPSTGMIVGAGRMRRAVVPLAGRPVRAGPRRADLPDLGADLRLQPGVRALPVELRAPRPARADAPTSAKAVIDELQRMQVFYVNIGGGEPTVRRDFWELVDYATAHHVGVKFSTNGSRITPRARRAAGRQRLRRRADLARRRDRRGQRRASAVPARTPRRSRRWSTSPRPACEDFKISVVVTRENVGAARRVQGDRRPLRRAAAAHAAAPVGPRRRRLGRAAPDRASSSASSTTGSLAHGEKVLTGDSFFHLAPLRRGAARA